MNIMEIIANAHGVKMGEEFSITNMSDKYLIDEKGLLNIDEDYYNDKLLNALNTGRFEIKRKTNYERIKEMSVDEMAELFEDDRCGHCDIDGVCYCSCKDGIKRWLNSPAE